MSINKKSIGIMEKSHKNFMGGTSFDINNPLMKLRIAASSCFFGEPMYYHKTKDSTPKLRVSSARRLSDADVKHLRDTLNAVDPQEWRSLSPSELMEKAIDEALDVSVEDTLKEAVRLRTEDHMRATPQVILVRAANHKNSKGTGLVRQYGKLIMQRADEPSTVIAYQLEKFGKPIPNSLKRVLADKLYEFGDYDLAKYRMDGRKVKTLDVVNLVHPQNTSSINKLMSGQLTLTENTWESIISKNGSNKESWTESLKVMGHMALLRNLRNLVEKEVPVESYRTKLIEGAKKGQQLPFRYFSAYRAIEGIAPGNLLDAIEESLMVSIDNLPSLPGKTISLCDNSGSARGSMTSSMGTVAINHIANLTGILTGLMSDDGYLGVFGDRLSRMPIRKKSSVFDMLKEANSLGDGVGGSTENGVWIFLRDAIANKEHFDNIFIFSDMQAGHGGLYGTDPKEYESFVFPNKGNYLDVAKLIQQYRSKVNSKVNVFLVQVAGYQDTIVPEFYDRTYILGGWGEGLLRFAASMANQ